MGPIIMVSNGGYLDVSHGLRLMDPDHIAAGSMWQFQPVLAQESRSVSPPKHAVNFVKLAEMHIKIWLRYLDSPLTPSVTH